MAIESSQDLFFYNLCSMYDVEQKLASVLPQLAQECGEQQVKEAFLEHQKETLQHVSNLQQCFQILGRSPLKLENRAVAGLQEDHEAFLEQRPSPQVLMLFDIGAGSKSEYLEIAAYHNLIQAAQSLSLQACIPFLEQNLKQEETAAKKLAMFAQQLGQQHTPIF